MTPQHLQLSTSANLFAALSDYLVRHVSAVGESLLASSHNGYSPPSHFSFFLCVKLTLALDCVQAYLANVSAPG